MSYEVFNKEQEIFGLSNVMGLSVPLWVFDIDHSRIAWANDAARKLWQAESFDELYTRNMSDDMSAAISARLQQYQNSFTLSDQYFREIWTLYPNDQPQSHCVRLRGHRLPDGRMGMLCEATSEEQRTPDRLRCAEALNHIPVSISMFSNEGKLLYANTESIEIYGGVSLALRDRFDDKEDYQRLLTDLHEQSHSVLICRVVCEGRLRWHEISARNSRDPVTGASAIILTEFDVTGLKEQEQKVRFMAHHDLLTGLHSRNYVNLAFPKRLSTALDAGSSLAMLLIDLDNFKTINDTLGHASGDRLLVHVAAVLERIIGRKFGKNGQIARLGGDEFIILLPYESPEQLEALCVRILAEISSDCSIQGHTISSKASIGVSLFPEHGDDLSSLMQHTDLALYEAKDAGRDTHRYFRPQLQQAALVRQALERDLCQAIDNKEFELYYQPRVDCQKQTVLSVEALMRWNHPKKGLVMPGHFIEILEETGLIHQAGDWIAEQAGIDQQLLASLGYDIPISINISPKQFERGDLVERLSANLATTGCSPDRIEIEITESMLMGEGFDAKSVLFSLRDVGFSIAIDDFGTGYSNLAYIQDYPISSLKVDRSFMQMIDDQSSVVNMILSLCRLIGVTAVAEGVETTSQLEWLQTNHCNQYQGYLYARPIPIGDLIALFENPPQLAVKDSLVDAIDLDLSWA